MKFAPPGSGRCRVVAARGGRLAPVQIACRGDQPTAAAVFVVAARIRRTRGRAAKLAFPRWQHMLGRTCTSLACRCQPAPPPRSARGWRSKARDENNSRQPAVFLPQVRPALPRPASTAPSAWRCALDEVRKRHWAAAVRSWMAAGAAQREPSADACLAAFTPDWPAAAGVLQPSQRACSASHQARQRPHIMPHPGWVAGQRQDLPDRHSATAPPLLSDRRIVDRCRAWCMRYKRQAGPRRRPTPRRSRGSLIWLSRSADCRPVLSDFRCAWAPRQNQSSLQSPRRRQAADPACCVLCHGLRGASRQRR